MAASARLSLYPEIGVGGYSRVDSSVEFYLRINALLRPDFAVLDFGAGRGRVFHDEPCLLRQQLQTLKGKVRHLVGADVDPVVMTNPGLDEAHRFDLAADGSFVLPFADASFDLIFSDWTFEHVSNPAVAAPELARILKPGGWLCARTPNRWGYIALGASLVPERLQGRVLQTMQPGRKEEDVFPKVYQLNTKSQLRRHFDAARFEHYVYNVNSEPSYTGNSLLMSRLLQGLFRILPESGNAIMLAFLRKK